MRKLLCLLALLLICAGCGPGVSRPAAGVNPEQHARQLAAAGNFQAAADEYLRLAGLYPKLAGRYTLLAAGASLDAGKIDDAAGLIDRADMSSAGPDGRTRKALLQAELALARGRSGEALSRTGATLPEGTPFELQAMRHNIRARAFGAAHDTLNAARERAALIAVLPGGAGRDRNIRELWSQLNSLDTGALDGARATADPNFRSWLELALINETMMARADLLKQSLESWVTAHTGHPAIPSITSGMLAASRRYNLQPRHIALLLPLNGEYQRASEAVRDGFLTAWYQDKNWRPRITIYDTSSLNISEVFQKAVKGGADFIVGPLQKSAVAQLAQMTPLTVTTLALNQDDAPDTGRLRPPTPEEFPTLMEFGLPPEDEARQVADRGVLDGHARALVITPGNDWGARLYRAFASEWESLGGRILAHVEYPSEANDYSSAVSTLLNTKSSNARARLLRHKLSRRLHSESRVRKDADMIFMAATPVAARQIVPQFLFYGAGNIATYATSHVFSGIVDAAVDSDLNGVRFPDMPWLLVPADLDSGLQKTINQNWKADKSPLRRLYAFGADAYRVIPRLGLLTTGGNQTYLGVTGTLYMDPDERIHRKLSWAEIVNGRPRRLDNDARHR